MLYIFIKKRKYFLQSISPRAISSSRRKSCCCLGAKNFARAQLAYKTIGKPRIFAMRISNFLRRRESLSHCAGCVYRRFVPLKYINLFIVYVKFFFIIARAISIWFEWENSSVRVALYALFKLAQLRYFAPRQWSYKKLPECARKIKTRFFFIIIDSTKVSNYFY